MESLDHKTATVIIPPEDAVHIDRALPLQGEVKYCGDCGSKV